MNQLRDKVLEALAAMAGLPTQEVTVETTFHSLALDSLDLVELTLMLEREMGVEIDPNDFMELVTVQDAIEVIQAATTLAA